MRKRKSTRETKNMIQTALWLPRDMHEQLKKAGGERGLGEEIRRRLSVSFGAKQQPSGDPLTDLLLDLVARVALKVSVDEEWWRSRSSFDAFKTSINHLLSELTSVEPPREAVDKFQKRYGSVETPESIGRKLAQAVLTENAIEGFRERFADNQSG